MTLTDYNVKRSHKTNLFIWYFKHK